MIDIEAIKKDCETIKKIINEACEIIIKEEYFLDEPYNVADFKCCEVDYKAMAENFIVTIDEAAPECKGIHEFVRKHLAVRGFENVEVNTEW